jgi:hypothetical protein
MRAYKVRTHVSENGSLTVENLPFPAGEAVEVIVLSEAREGKEQQRYPLRGTVIQYIDPTMPLVERKNGGRMPRQSWKTIRSIADPETISRAEIKTAAILSSMDREDFTKFVADEDQKEPHQKRDERRG